MDFDAFRPTLDAIAAAQGWALEHQPSWETRVRIPLPGGRLQVVRIFAASDPEHEPVIVVWSTSGGRHAITDGAAVLAFGGTLVYGAPVVVGDEVAIRHVLRPSQCDANSVAKIAFHVAWAADRMEAAAYGHDAL